MNNNNKNDDHSNVQVLAVGDVAMLFRNCADCGAKTGRFLRHLPGKKQVPGRGMGAGSDDPPVRVVRQRAKRLSLLLRKVVGRPTSLWS